MEQDILQANTFGVGDLVLHALNHGSTSFVIGIGGSVTREAEELYGRGIDALIGLPCVAISLHESIEQAADLLAFSAETAVWAFSASWKRGGVRSGTSETDGISGKEPAPR